MRNLQLRKAGLLNVVMPIGEPELAGIGVFAGTPEQVTDWLADDPAIVAGVLTFSVHAARGFPGDALA